MILDYYQLREQPFGVTPDSRFLYASATHREALASLLYAIESGRGFAALIAQPGMGKTTLLHEALRRLQGKARTVFLFQTVLTPVEFLNVLLADLGCIPPLLPTPASYAYRGPRFRKDGAPSSLVELQSRLNQVLEEQTRSGKPLVVFIDEAQNLGNEVLEMVRMLSNFETSREKLMQIVLSGQPQLAERLQGADLVQLRQRISVLSRLAPFSLEEVTHYIAHRLRAAGYADEKLLFTKEATALIAQNSQGIPRNINNLCFNALSLGSVLKRKPIDEEVLREVIADLDLGTLTAEKACAPISPSQPLTASAAAGLPAKRQAKRVPVLAWAGITALILAAVLVFAGMRAGAGRRGPKVAIAAAPVPQTAPRISVKPVQVPVPSVAETVQPTTSVVKVAPGETLYHICIKHLGSYTPEIIAEVRRLNPWLTNPSRIHSGRVIRIPVRESDGKGQSVAQVVTGRLIGTGDSQ